jgi:hypothetical protein
LQYATLTGVASIGQAAWILWHGPDARRCSRKKRRVQLQRLPAPNVPLLLLLLLLLLLRLLLLVVMAVRL